MRAAIFLSTNACSRPNEDANTHDRFHSTVYCSKPIHRPNQTQKQARSRSSDRSQGPQNASPHSKTVTQSTSSRQFWEIHALFLAFAKLGVQKNAKYEYRYRNGYSTHIWRFLHTRSRGVDNSTPRHCSPIRKSALHGPKNLPCRTRSRQTRQQSRARARWPRRHPHHAWRNRDSTSKTR